MVCWQRWVRGVNGEAVNGEGVNEVVEKSEEYIKQRKTEAMNVAGAFGAAKASNGSEVDVTIH